MNLFFVFLSQFVLSVVMGFYLNDSKKGVSSKEAKLAFIASLIGFLIITPSTDEQFIEMLIYLSIFVFLSIYGIIVGELLFIKLSERFISRLRINDIKEHLHYLLETLDKAEKEAEVLRKEITEHLKEIEMILIQSKPIFGILKMKRVDNMLFNLIDLCRTLNRTLNEEPIDDLKQKIQLYKKIIMRINNMITLLEKTTTNHISTKATKLSFLRLIKSINK